MAASLYRDDREAMFLGKYEETECLEMFNEFENSVYNSSPDQLNGVADMLINIEAEEQHNLDSPTISSETRMSIHPDLVGIDFSLPANKPAKVLYKENTSSGLPKINCDTSTTNVNPVSQMCTDKFEVTASPCVNVPQEVKVSGREQCLLLCTKDVPVCNDLVDLSNEVNKEVHNEPSVVVLNPDLKGLAFPVPKSAVHSVNSITFELCNNCPFLQGQVNGIPTSLLCDTGASVTTISEKLFDKLPDCKKISGKTFQQAIRTVSGENMPIKGLALVPFQIGEYNYTFYAYIIENLAYEAILGSDFLGHYQAVVNFDNHSPELLPPSEKSPPYPAWNLLCSLHAYRTCVIPPNTESVIAATLNCDIDLPISGLVGIIESNPTLAERYQVCGAAALVTVTTESTVPFRIINPTSQPDSHIQFTQLHSIILFHSVRCGEILLDKKEQYC